MESILLNGRYHLLELVGSGGMAVVYRGVDTLLERQIAVKVLRESFASDPAFLARFQREARSAANLEHPNIVTVHDVGQDDDRHYIVMEYVDGQDLKTLIRQKGRLSVDEALDISIQVCAGVGHAHKAGIIHCDIKPQNVLLTRDGRAKVTDFGIARALTQSGITESETVWGSPLYFSPEQAAGEPPAPASDVYSIGVVLYEMLAGLPPFQAEKPAALALMHMREEPPPIAVRNPQVPSQLEWVIRKIMAKEPSARYRTAGQLGHVLEEYRKQSEQLTGWQPAVPRSLPAVPAIPSLPSRERSAKPEYVSPSPSSPADRLIWVLGMVAFIAIVGLIPLWLSVYRAYSAQPSPVPGPTPTSPVATLTPEVQLVSVPNVEGKPVEVARSLVELEGLRLVVSEEREEPGAEKGIVLEQDPAAGEMVPVETEVSVVVSSAGRELTMPGVEGYPVEIVRDGLESDGLQVVVEQVWCTQVEGMVIDQEPDRGATIYAGDTVTLTASGGVNVPIPLDVNLGGLFVLESARLPRGTYRPGDVVAVTFCWRALRTTGTHYVVFVHLVDSGSRLVAQQDTEPVDPTVDWVPGVIVTDPHEVEVPLGQAAGTYQLRVGMYPQGQPASRLPVVDAGATTAESDSILVAEIEVRP